MAVYRIRHRTTYTYTEPVSLCHNLAHLLPRLSLRHSWSMRQIEISPLPAMRGERDDCFGNPITFFAIQEPHRKLEVVAMGRVEVRPPENDGPACQQPWETVREHLTAEIPGDAYEARPFVCPSPHVQWDEAVLDYARDSFKPGRAVIEAVVSLTQRIHRDFQYNPEATTVTTTVREVMDHRRGVCQDLAHVQVACLRAMGLAARYVSGYLLTSAPAGRSRLTGADASHAWVSVYVPEAGWLDFDPTNNLRPSDKHITIAWGRDYGDVCPLRGVLLGGGNQAVSVAVDVSPES